MLPFGVAQWFGLGTSMLEVSSWKLLASESKGVAFWVELVAPGLPSAGAGDGVDTFEAPRHQNDRNEDIEMGIQRPMDSGELGLDEFFKQVQQIEKQYEKLEKLLKKLQV
ncbi:hypothetical protein MTR67_002597 [Solanum verrucosum]|uniref:Uncharacterized protein n=1 Tax=Solanum verrucosum TaxID=315347 RepID=A0AAF0PRB7_SOLVR|nr:hypothetical protein MTR67_002597 [Solanum verrucosum]